MTDLDILYLPAQWRELPPARLQPAACAVIDVIRATSTIATALAHGALGIQPVTSVPDAFVLKALNPDSLLAGERGGRPLPGFDLGNSPEDFTPERVTGKRVILTTTNGTAALAACRGARAVITASLLNLDAVAARLIQLGPPWTIVCAGCEGQFGVDDAIVAGALADALGCDHPLISLYHSVRDDLTESLQASAAGRELFKVGMEKDIPFCARRNIFQIAPTWSDDGLLR
jgi:2-phosphosulfolactate phosphatase